MMIKNLQVEFDRQEGDKLIFKSEAGAEVAVTDYLLDGQEYKSKKIYLGVDAEPMVSSTESKKDTLNELLNNNG